MIYDSDGFDIDERVDFAGLSSSSFSYRLMRDIESQAVRDAARVVIRTESARPILIARAGPPVDEGRFQVVTNGRDENVFHPHSPADRARARQEIGVDADAPLIAYVGTIGHRQRTEQVGQLALALRRLRPDTRLLVLTGSPEEARLLLIEPMRELAELTTIMRVPAGDVARYLAAADVGTAQVHKSFSTQGISPLKTAEYLLCGVPVVGTSGVGLNNRALEAGTLFDEAAGPEAAAGWIQQSVLANREEFRIRARAVGVEHFSLTRSVADYRRAMEAVRAISQAGAPAR
jgi:glycosyltransferase involved in cell wall biosynthesis